MDQNNDRKPKHRKVYDEEFKRAVIDVWQSGDKSAAQVAAEFGLDAGSLRVWKMRYGLNGQTVPSAASQTKEQLAKENTALRRELARVITQRDILKKTLLIVSEPSHKDIA